MRALWCTSKGFSLPKQRNLDTNLKTGLKNGVRPLIFFANYLLN